MMAFISSLLIVYPHMVSFYIMSKMSVFIQVFRIFVYPMWVLNYTGIWYYNWVKWQGEYILNGVERFRRAFMWL